MQQCWSSPFYYFVITFVEHLSGVDFEKREIVRIRNRYDASVPTVVGAVEREKPVFVEDAKFLRSCTYRQIKWSLPGPITMVNTLYDAHYRSREKQAWEFATILNQEARELKPLEWMSSSSMSQRSTSSSTRPRRGHRNFGTYL